MQIITQIDIEKKIIEIRQQKVIIDSDVAELYEVETKHVNQAVKNNPERFPDGFILNLTNHEKEEVVKNFDHLKNLKFSKVNPKAFTEQGLYMLATILKSSKASEVTVAIVKTFAMVREISRSINQLTMLPSGSDQQKSLVNHTGELLSELIQPGDLDKSETEASIELNFALVKFKYSVKKSK